MKVQDSRELAPAIGDAVEREGTPALDRSRVEPRLAIVVPCFNEELVIRESALRLASVLRDLKEKQRNDLIGPLASSEHGKRVQKVPCVPRDAVGERPPVPGGRVHLVHPGQTDHKDATTVIRAPTTKTIDGTYTIRVDVTGRTSRGTPFARVGYRSVFVGY